jgi:hypothetical protein
MSEILPGLYLGDMGNARDKKFLEEINCKYILQVTNSCSNFFPDVTFIYSDVYAGLQI